MDTKKTPSLAVSQTNSDSRLKQRACNGLKNNSTNYIYTYILNICYKKIVFHDVNEAAQNTTQH